MEAFAVLFVVFLGCLLTAIIIVDLRNYFAKKSFKNKVNGKRK